MNDKLISYNPATSEKVGETSISSKEDVHAVVEKAHEAFSESNYEKIFGHLPATDTEKDFFEGVKFLNMSIQKLRNEKAHTPANEVERNLAIHYISLSSLAYDLITKNFELNIS